MAALDTTYTRPNVGAHSLLAKWEPELPFRKELASRNALNPMDPRIKFALKVMSDPTCGELTVDRLAEEVGLSASRFEHILKRATGRTFRQHKQSMRIRQAKTLLEDRHLSLKQIAYLVGYSSPSSFSRAFRNSVLRSPSRYRMKVLLRERQCDCAKPTGQVQKQQIRSSDSRRPAQLFNSILSLTKKPL